VTCRKPQNRSAFTLVEVLVAAAVFGIFAAALLASWVALGTTAMNTTSYAQRQNDQMRVADYLKRDIRSAATVDVYDSTGALVSGTTFGSELRLTVPHYYSDSREEDNAIGTNTPNTPSLSGTAVTYGSTLTIRYYTSNGAVIRNESGIERTIADAAGGFTVSFSKLASGDIQSRLIFNQRMRSGGNRNLQRQVDLVTNQRTQLQL